MNTILEVSHLTVRFGSNAVLKDVSFQVEGGSALAIIGPNGAGKTVLFRALIGAVPFEGAVTWGEGVRIGYVPQKLDLERDIPITGVDFLRARAALVGRTDDIDKVLGLVDAVQDVQHRALAGAVRPDDGAHLVLAHIERNVGEGLHPPESEGNAFDGEQRSAQAARRAAAGGKVLASAMRRSADTLPVRPSS